MRILEGLIFVKIRSFGSRLFALFLALSLIILSLTPSSLAAEDEAHDSLVTGFIEGRPFLFGPEDLQSKTAILIVRQGEEVKPLLHFRQDQRVYIASLTKLMTGYLAYRLMEEKGLGLDDRARVMSLDLQGLVELNASLAGFQAGEMVNFRDLFYGLFLSSGCEAANSLARETCGSQKAFVELMNEMAGDLGLKDSHFTNSHGLFEADNYGTAEDMAHLLLALYEVDFLREVLTSRHYRTGTNPVHPQGLALVHSLSLYSAETGQDTSLIEGAKTGQLKEAGYCLASFREMDDLVLVAVTTGAEGADGHIRDHQALYRAFLDQVPQEGPFEVTGIGQKLPLKPDPPLEEPGQEEGMPEEKAGPRALLTTIAIGLLAFLLLLGLVLLVSLLARKKLEKDLQSKSGRGRL